MLCPQRETASFTPRLSYPIPGLDRPLGFQGFVSPKIYRQSGHEGGGFIPILRPPSFADVTISTHFYEKLSRPQDLSAAGNIKLMKNSSNIIGNRTREIPACCAVPRHLHHRVPSHP
jgi:hypothetical protein